MRTLSWSSGNAHWCRKRSRNRLVWRPIVEDGFWIQMYPNACRNNDKKDHEAAVPAIVIALFNSLGCWLRTERIQTFDVLLPIGTVFAHTATVMASSRRGELVAIVVVVLAVPGQRSFFARPPATEWLCPFSSWGTHECLDGMEDHTGSSRQTSSLSGQKRGKEWDAPLFTPLLLLLRRIVHISKWDKRWLLLDPHRSANEEHIETPSNVSPNSTKTSHTLLGKEIMPTSDTMCRRGPVFVLKQSKVTTLFYISSSVSSTFIVICRNIPIYINIYVISHVVIAVPVPWLLR